MSSLILIIVALATVVIMGLSFSIFKILQEKNQPYISLNVRVSPYDEEASYLIGEITNTGNKTLENIVVKSNIKDSILQWGELAIVDKLKFKNNELITLAPKAKKEILLGTIQTISTINPEIIEKSIDYKTIDTLPILNYYIEEDKIDKNDVTTKNKTDKKPKKKNNDDKQEDLDNDKLTNDDEPVLSLFPHHELFSQAEEEMLKCYKKRLDFDRAHIQREKVFSNTLVFDDGRESRSLYRVKPYHSRSGGEEL